jgi:hypothetical protein
MSAECKATQYETVVLALFGSTTKFNLADVEVLEDTELKVMAGRSETAMVMLPELAVDPTASVTVTVKVLFPTAVGVPEITPVAAFKLNPAGIAPLVTAQLA